MNSNLRSLKSRLSPLALLVLGTVALAQNPLPIHLNGVIDDYSPSTVKGGPWEIRGTWSLDLLGRSGSANFSSSLAMETSDYGITEGIVNPTQPVTRSAHTHHIALTNAIVSTDISTCPAFNPATTTGFQVNGTVTLITGNGGPAPFETDPPSTTLQVCVTGGSDVGSSNVTLVFSGPATKHFGTQAIHGVVQ